MNAVSQSPTLRFFGALKNYFTRADTNGNHKPQPVVAPKPAPAAPTPPPSPSPKANGSNENVIVLPLQVVVMAMSQELKAKVRAAISDDLTVSVSVEKILPQLGKGVVKIPFGDVRRAAPQVFAIGIDHDHLPVMLPLSEILPRMNPASLPRRNSQKQQAQVSDDIISPFNIGGRGLSITTEPAKPAPAAQPLPRRVPPFGSSLPPNRTVTPATGNGGKTERFEFKPAAKVPPLTPPTAVTPVAPVAPVRPVTPRAPVMPITPIAPEADADQFKPIPMRAVSPIAPKVATPTPTQPAETAPITPISPIAPSPAPAPVIPSGPPFIVPISAVLDGWPDSLRQEISKSGVAVSKLALPSSLVENGLKRGRVAFPWKQLRTWITPAFPAAASPFDEIEVVLPLQTIAPLFLSAQKAAKARAAQAQPAASLVDESIPNLFFGFPQPDTAAPAPAPIPIASPVVAAPVAAELPKPVDTNYYVFADDNDTAFVEGPNAQKPTPAKVSNTSSGTDFVVKYATPNEIVSRAAALDGVAGVIIALPDGLSVASKIPETLNGDTLAAFLPQLFSKMTQCTKELRMGELNNLNFTVGNVPWKIFRVNAVYFAAFGHAGQPLPTAQLAALAGELDRKNKR